MDFEQIKTIIKDMLSEHRYNHTLGVVDAAEELALLYNSNVEKARLAAICHDCAKEIDSAELISIARQNGIELDDVMISETHILHGPVGSAIAEMKFHVHDREVLNAIRYHTTGRADMTLLEKIIYLSDIIEIGRDYTGVEEIREVSRIELNKAVVLAIDGTIKHVISKNSLLHPLTVDARNFILVNR